VTLRATPIRRCITSAGAAGGRTAEVGIVSMSPGQAETTTGDREVRNTKEGTHDDVGNIASCHVGLVHLVLSF
jgi:hypothetical protein